MATKGIDVSGWNGEIDFSKVKASGIDFVIIKAGYSTNTVDTWEHNYTNAKVAGLHVGAYWYSYAETVDCAKKEANSFIAALKGKQLDFPVFFDLEESKQISKGKNFCSSIADAFCGTLKSAGYLAGLYMSRSPLQTHINADIAKKYELWIAEWGSRCNYKGTFGIWQYSEKGTVNGISGKVDLDYCYKDYPTTIKNGGYNGYSKSSATTTNTKPATTNNKVVYSPLSEIIDPKVGSVTAIFREYSKTLWSSGWHNGVDIGAPANTPVKAVADGTVVDNSTMKQRPTDNFGNRVIIEHADGVFSVYAHLIAPTTLKVGDKVKRGQIVGKVGGTGKTQNQYGNHLHLTMLKGFKKELYNIYYVNNELLDPIKMCGMGTMKFSTLANDTILENGAIKYLGNLNTYYGVSTTNTSTVTSNKNSATSANIKVGDIVEFTGSTHYGSSTATKGTDATAGKAKVTAIAPNAAHKYHLVHVDSTSNVYGWVNASDIKVAGTKSLDELANEVIRGDWGNGVDRKNRLTSAGYDYATVQKKVNEKLNK